MERQVLFGRKLRLIRENANLSRELAAEKAHINANYLGELERGEKWPSFEVLETIANALKVPVDKLFQFDDQETDPAILRTKINAIVTSRSVVELQQILQLLMALFPERY